VIEIFLLDVNMLFICRYVTSANRT